MKVYLVGGAVRDQVMGRASKDRDWVVVGSDSKEMIDAGYRQVGKDFPIFLHPTNSEEYALARRVRRPNEAYSFDKSVTLKEDLLKRDLTMNAMAIDPATNHIIDPYGGLADIYNKVLRMTHMASLREDPIRILRIARFAARFPEFSIDPHTLRAMDYFTNAGFLDNLVQERVWKELSRGLMEERPSRMLQVLRQCGALVKVLPEVDALYGVPQPEQHHPEIDTGIHIEQALDIAAREDLMPASRLAVLLHDVGKAITPKENWPSHHGHESLGVPLVEAICDRLRVSGPMRHVAVTTAREHGNIHSALKVKVTTLVKIMRRCDAFRRPNLFLQVLEAVTCDARGRKGPTGDHSHMRYPQAERFENALMVANQVKGGAEAERHKDRPEFIPAAIHAARARAIRREEKLAEERARTPSPMQIGLLSVKHLG